MFSGDDYVLHALRFMFICYFSFNMTQVFEIVMFITIFSYNMLKFLEIVMFYNFLEISMIFTPKKVMLFPKNVNIT